MKLNFKARLHNKAFVIAMLTLAVSFVYKLLSLCGITPDFGEASAVNLLMLVCDLLCSLGILVDPTTRGIGDSERALGYYKSDGT
ncbi:MAG: phage holin [Clostridia bacterium]|nr:phage holin [Clostridia bacterium]